MSKDRESSGGFVSFAALRGAAEAAPPGVPQRVGFKCVTRVERVFFLTYYWRCRFRLPSVEATVSARSAGDGHVSRGGGTPRVQLAPKEDSRRARTVVSVRRSCTLHAQSTCVCACVRAGGLGIAGIGGVCTGPVSAGKLGAAGARTSGHGPAACSTVRQAHAWKCVRTLF